MAEDQEETKARRKRLDAVGIKVEEQRDGTIAINFKGLGKKKRQELINLLRKNFLYQQPRPVFKDYADTAPAFLICRMMPDDYGRMMELIKEAGGWFAPSDTLAAMAKAGGGTGSIACPHNLDDWRKCRLCLGEATSRELEALGQVVIDPNDPNVG